LVHLMSSPAAFGERLKALRERAGLTQAQLAERISVKREAVARWEAGGSEPVWSNVLKLAGALGVGIEEFAAGEAPPTQE
jgi:transcriptional regulator with XRE-family HTH domain